MNAETLLSIAERHGTPCYVFDQDALSERMTAIRAIVPDSIGLWYSIKANPFLLSRMMSLVEGCEVCSPGEFDLCMNSRVDPGRIILSGVNKRRADVEAALDGGVSVFTAESPRQATLIDECAGRRGVRVTLIPRLNGGNQFGMVLDDVVNLFAGKRSYGNLNIDGLHFFSGTQKKRADAITAELTFLDETCGMIREKTGVEIRRLQYGPGFGVPYFTTDADGSDMALLRECLPGLLRLADRHRAALEMGRFLTAFCGHYLTRVDDVKSGHDIRYAIVDGGIHHVVYSGQNMGLRIPHIRNLTRPSGGSGEQWAICGSLCTTNDFLVRSMELSLEENDILCFDRVGAYSVTEGLSLFLSRDLPKVILVENEKDELARDAFQTSRLNQSAGGGVKYL